MSKNTFSSIHVTIRPARIVDLPGIMEIEREEFGDGIGADAMAAEKVMADRIRRCNNKYRTWFWVASAEKKNCWVHDRPANQYHLGDLYLVGTSN